MRIVAVRIMASAATHLSLPEALRTLERFDNERGLAKPAVLVETLTGEISEWNPGILAEEMIGGQIIQFARRSRRTNRRLHVALGADAYEITIANVLEIDRRIERLLRFVIARRQIHDVLQRGAMAHLAIDARLLELQTLDLQIRRPSRCVTGWYDRRRRSPGSWWLAPNFSHERRSARSLPGRSMTFQ